MKENVVGWSGMHVWDVRYGVEIESTSNRVDSFRDPLSPIAARK